jgi:hypothetical protein
VKAVGSVVEIEIAMLVYAEARQVLKN